jgi:hypothetical protein
MLFVHRIVWGLIDHAVAQSLSPYLSVFHQMIAGGSRQVTIKTIKVIALFEDIFCLSISAVLLVCNAESLRLL